MIRSRLAAAGQPRKEEFRWRGAEVTRIEGLTDAVFGFAITLLVVSLEVPANFDRLQQAMAGFLAFAVSFVLLISVWHEHYYFFRRYGLQDRVTDYLNYFLLFVILFYVYPLKFLFTILTVVYTGRSLSAEVIRPDQMPDLMAIFSLGFTAVNGVFLMLNIHAYRQRARLELNAVEMLVNREGIIGNLVQVGIGVASLTLALVFRNGGMAGWIYMLLGPLMAFLGIHFGKRRRLLAGHASAQSQPG